MEEPKYPHAVADLSDVDGNAISIIMACRRALLDSNVKMAEIKDFTAEAMRGDYDNVFATARKWLTVL